MNKYKISIIVPVYNVEKYLPECLDSLVNQTLKEIEIICVNDGTKDNSLEILERYASRDERIKIINQENQGVSVARNMGIAKATGEYIGFVDPDDWIDLDFFEKLYNAAKKYNSDIAAGNTYKHINPNKKRNLFKYSEEKYFTETDIKIKEAKIPKLNYIWNKIYRREKILSIQFPAGFCFEDIDWSVKAVYYLDGFVTVPNTFYHYIEHPETITKKIEKYKNDYEKMEKACIDFFKEKNINMLIPLKIIDKTYKLKILGLTVVKTEYFYPNIQRIKLFGIKVMTRKLSQNIEI